MATFVSNVSDSSDIRWGEENRIHPMQPLRALLRPSASKVSGGPAPPETPVTGPTLPSVEVQPVGVRRRSNAPYVV